MKKFATTLALLALIQSPAIAQAPDAAAGKSLWEGNNTFCKNCHGKTGEGAFGPDLAGRGLSASQFWRPGRRLRADEGPCLQPHHRDAEVRAHAARLAPAHGKFQPAAAVRR